MRPATLGTVSDAGSGILAAPGAVPEPTPTAAPLLVLPTPTPTVEPTPTPAPTPQTYQLRPGDTLFELAMRYDVALEDLLAANNLTEDDFYTIQPGQEHHHSVG